MKKIMIVIMAAMIFFISLVYPSSRTSANPLAVPVGAGAYAGAVIAGGALMYGLGQTDVGDDLVAHGNKVWNTTTTATQEAFDTALNAGVSYAVTNWGVPSLQDHIMKMELSEQVWNSLYDNALLTTVNGYAGYKADESGVSMTGVCWGGTYPCISYKNPVFGAGYALLIQDMKYRTQYLAKSVSLGNEAWWISTYSYVGNPNVNTGTTQVSGSYGGQWAYGMRDAQPQSAGAWVNAVNSRAIEMGVAVSVKIVSDRAMDLPTYTGVKDKLREQWESMKDAGMVVPVSAVEAVNPGITYNPESKAWTNDAGTVYNPSDLAFPVPKVHEGKLAIPIPNSGAGTITGEDVYVDTGTGAIVGNPPIAKPVDEVGWLSSIWGAITGLGAGIGTIATSLTTGLVGTPADIKWDKLKGVGTLFTTKFPFSLPWDAKNAMDSVFGGFAVKDELKFDFDIEFNNKMYFFDMTIDDYFMKWFDFARIAILILFDIGMIYAIRQWFGGAS